MCTVQRKICAVTTMHHKRETHAHSEISSWQQWDFFVTVCQGDSPGELNEAHGIGGGSHVSILKDALTHDSRLWTCDSLLWTRDRDFELVIHDFELAIEHVIRDFELGIATLNLRSWLKTRNSCLNLQFAPLNLWSQFWTCDWTHDSRLWTCNHDWTGDHDLNLVIRDFELAIHDFELAIATLNMRSRLWTCDRDFNSRFMTTSVFCCIKTLQALIRTWRLLFMFVCC